MILITYTPNNSANFVKKLNQMYRLIIVFTFLALSSPLCSQSVVHAESGRLKADMQGFSGNIEMGLNFVQNINNVFSSQNASQFQYVSKRHIFTSLNALNLTVFNEARILNDGFQHLRYGNTINKKIRWEGFLQAQYNEIIKISGRYLAGTGPLFKIIDADQDSVNLYYSTAYMLEYEEETTGVINRHQRWNNMLSVNWPISKKVDLSLISYYQPDLTNFKDFRISSEISLKINIIKRLNLKYSMALFYDTKPPEEIRNIFYNIKNTLSFDL